MSSQQLCHVSCWCTSCTALRHRASLRTRCICLRCEKNTAERGRLNCFECLVQQREHYRLVTRNRIERVVEKICKSAARRRLEMQLQRRQIAWLITSECYYCGYKWDASRQDGFLGLDRVDSALGYLHGNVVPCCADCNYAKSDRTQDLFLYKSRKVARRHRYTLSPYSESSFEAPF